MRANQFKKETVSDGHHLMKMLIMMIFAILLLVFFGLRDSTTEVVTITEELTLVPGEGLPTSDSDYVIYTGPQNGKGRMLDFLLMNGTSSGKTEERTIPFEKGEPLPFDQMTGERMVFKGYEGGALTIAYTHKKSVSRP